MAWFAQHLPELIDFCRTCGPEQWAQMSVAGALSLAAGVAAPVAISALLLGGAAFSQHRDKKISDADFRAHFAEVAAALELIGKDNERAVEMLEQIHSRSRFVWAKIDGEDKQALANLVWDTLRPLLEDLWILGSDTNTRVREMQVRQGEQATKQDLAETEARIRAMLEANKQGGVDPTQQPWPPELIERAKVLLERGTKEQRAVAEIALRNHAAADAIIQELKALPLAELFRLLTLEGDNWYQAGEFDRAVGPYEQALALRPDDFTARNNAAVAHARARLGNLSEHRMRAIELFRGTLDRVPAGSPNWAVTQNNLGNAYRGLPTGDRGKNLARAIACYERALTVWTKGAHPVDWAGTQNNLGLAYAGLPTGDRGENLARAIACYEQALTVWTKGAHPVEWATAQHNGAIALADLALIPGQDRCGLLRRAISSGKGALTVFTERAHPREHADTRRNLDIHIRAYANAGCAATVRVEDILAAE